MGVNADRAFPRAGCQWTEDHGEDAFAQDGMSLREYYAAKAMQTLLLSELTRLQGVKFNLINCQTIAEAAFVMADEMLIAANAAAKGDADNA